MATQFHRAQHKKTRLRLAIAGPAGSGKTYNALMIGFGLGGPVVLIDTEGKADELAHLGEYDVCSLAAPFTPEKYVEAITAAENAGYEVIIIDSLSHAWADLGGAQDVQGQAAEQGGNANALEEALLQSRCHIIAIPCSPKEDEPTTDNGNPIQQTTKPAPTANKKRLF